MDRFLRALVRRRPIAAAALGVLAAITLAALLAPALGLIAPDRIDMAGRLAPPGSGHPLGTDNFGRDILSRVVYSGRVSLLIGLGVMAASTAAGTLVGLAAGYYRRVDAVAMRVLDGLMSFPAILLALALVAALGVGARNEIIAIALVYFPRTARIVRGSTLQLKQRAFVEAAVALGEGDGRILTVHILRNALTPLIVQSTFVFAEAILADAALSFLGLGVRPPTPTWGNMLDDAHIYVETAPWFVVFPGVAIVLTVLSLNLVGDALRDLADPYAAAARRGLGAAGGPAAGDHDTRAAGPGTRDAVRGLPEPAQE
ncbi:MAG TPA: ABC transporter permease [bacterium]|nr:ABC transporter permease [bacterium]